MLSKTPRWILAATLGLGALACGDAGDAEDASLEAAICAPDARPLLLTRPERTTTLASGGVGGATLAILDANTTVARVRTMEDVPGVPMSFVEVRSGRHVGKSGWVDARGLVIRAPRSGQCDNGANYEAKASAFERAQSTTDEIPVSVLDDTMACAFEAVTGVAQQGTRVRVWAEGLLPQLQEVWRRDRDLILYVFGSDAMHAEARRHLERAADVDAASARGMIGALAHGLPTLHQQLRADWAFYRQMPAAEKGRYLCRVAGAASFEVLLALMSGRISSRQAPTTVAALDELNANAARATVFTEQEGAEGLIRIDPTKFQATQEVAYWTRLQQVLERTGLTGGATRRAAIRQVSEDINVPHWAKGAGVKAGFPVGGGNCRNAAATVLFALHTGRLICTLPYFPGVDRPIADTFRKLNVLREEIDTGSDAAAITRALDAKLAEREMAYLRTGNSKAGHATAVIKLDGQLYSINNQTWYERLGVPSGELQTLSQWTASWIRYSAENGGIRDLSFRAIVTKLRLPEHVG